MKFKKQPNVPFFSKYMREDGKYTIESTDIRVNGTLKGVFEVRDEEGNVIDVLPRLKDAKAKYSGENEEVEEKETKEEKKMTVKEMRMEAKELGIKGYSKMSKEELQKALEEKTATEEDFNGEVKVEMRAFTGMVLGIFTATYTNGIYNVQTKKGILTFNKDGKQLNVKNPKFANRIETKLSPDDFLTGESIVARGCSIFHVTTMTKEDMNKLGYYYVTEEGNYEIFGNGTRAFAIAK